jgi:hypothetical protein
MAEISAGKYKVFQGQLTMSAVSGQVAFSPILDVGNYMNISPYVGIYLQVGGNPGRTSSCQAWVAKGYAAPTSSVTSAQRSTCSAMYHDVGANKLVTAGTSISGVSIITESSKGKYFTAYHCLAPYIAIGAYEELQSITTSTAYVSYAVHCI